MKDNLTQSYTDDLKLNEILAKMPDWHNALIFDSLGKIISSISQIENTNINQIIEAFQERKKAISTGLFFQGQRFEIYRWYPPLIIGRSGLPSESVGVAVLKGSIPDGQEVFLVVTYKLPNLSSKIVPQMQEFFSKHVGHLEKYPISHLVNHPKWNLD